MNPAVTLTEEQIRSTLAKERTMHKCLKVEGLDIYYRQAGPKDAPTILLLHGFPTSSHMFRNLIGALADRYHVVAPDYPGFGNSSMPSPEQFEYTFDRLAEVIEGFIEGLGLDKYSLYVMDYGAPVGFRIAAKHPERVQALIIQNGNAYEEGLGQFWEPIRAYWKERTAANAQPLLKLLTMESTKWQYTNGVRDVEAISPDNWIFDQALLDRPGNNDIMMELFYDYRSNPPLYPQWQEYFRKHQPPTLIVWGKNDLIFPAEGAHPYKRDLTNIEFHLLDTGHFALEEDGELIAALIREFMANNVARPRPESEVKQALDEFYAALNKMFTGDIGPMSELWSHGSDVTNMGPFGGRHVGWNQVGPELERQARMNLGGRVICRDELINVNGNLAYCLCVEHGEHMGGGATPISIEHRATGIFRRENGKWKMVHHHTDIEPQLQEAVGKVE